MKPEQNQEAEFIAAHHRAVEQKANEMEAARRSAEERAEQLALVSKYKSVFLANMSHELRTPLNSLLVLSELLAENEEGNLTPTQIEFAETIHACGSELLALLNDILDLAKIESGKIVVDFTEINLRDLQKDLELNFCELAKLKELDFRIEITERVAQSIYTDGRRLNQILRNLLSNALKFTDKGRVTLLIDQGSPVFDRNTGLESANDVISFVVSDTGIGIAKDKQKMIFDAFQQADGTTSRRYGGTGLGLAISRELTALLGGQLEVASELGKGSSFTLHLPASRTTQPNGIGDSAIDGDNIRIEKLLLPNNPDLQAIDDAVADDRCTILAGDLVFLLIAKDITFARMVQMMAIDRGFKTLVTASREVGLSLAEKFLPQAITLDLKLANGDGWTTLESLRRNKKTRLIPLLLVTIEGQNNQRSSLLEPATTLPEHQFDEICMFLDRIKQNLSDNFKGQAGGGSTE